jgi:hypothetical protein
MAAICMHSIAFRACPAACLLMGYIFSISPTMAQSTPSVTAYLGVTSPAPQKQVEPAVLPASSEAEAPSFTDNAEFKAPESPAAVLGQEVGAAQPTQNPPQVVKPLDAVSVMDSYEQRLEGMRMSTILTRRPVLATDPLDSPASARIQTEQNEEPKRWLIDPADVTLRQTLLRWSDSIGWQLIWEADKDFAIDARVELHTTFKSALETMMLSLADSAYPLQAILNRDARIVRVQRYMEQRTR